MITSCLKQGTMLIPAKRTGSSFKILSTAIYLTILFVVAMKWCGYLIAVPLAIGVAVWFTIQNYQRRWPLALIYAAVFLALFDNKSFVWDAIGIKGAFRLAYLPLLGMVVFWLLSMCLSRKRSFCASLPALTVSLTLIIWLLISLVFLIFEPLQAKLYSIKYWLFTFLPVVSISVYLGKTNDEHFYLYWLMLSVFVCLFGISQFIFRSFGLLDFLSPKQYGFANNPIGFFSERTWLGVMAVFGVAFLSYLREIRQFGVRTFGVCFSILFMAVILSYSRNAYMGLIIFFVMSIISGLKRTVALTVSLVLLVSIVALFLFWTAFDTSSLVSAPGQAVVKVASGFVNGNKSSFGRIENQSLVLQRYAGGYYYMFGNGFGWDVGIEGGGTGGAIGAKSNNVFLFIFHIFGFEGLIPVLVLLMYFYWVGFKRWRYSVRLKYALITFTMWLAMAQFAPLHQYGITVLLLGIILGLFIRGKSAPWKTNENSISA